jgi:hypothetical protein
MNWFSKDPQAVVATQEAEQVDLEEIRQVLGLRDERRFEVVVARDRIVTVPRDWLEAARDRGQLQVQLVY